MNTILNCILLKVFCEVKISLVLLSLWVLIVYSYDIEVISRVICL
jgi:hypothetical protein